MNIQLTYTRRHPAHRLTYTLSLIAAVLLAGCSYHVDTTIDAPDANPGDFRCARALRSGESLKAVEAEGLCTLRAAIMEANATAVKDNIFIPAGTYPLTLPAAEGGGNLTVSNSVLIHGSGKYDTIISQEISTNVLEITHGDVQIDNLTVTGGNAQHGGGLAVFAASVTIVDVFVRDNFGFTGGGGITIAGDGELRITRASITDNSATGAFGGGIWNQGELWVYDSTIAGNHSNRSGGIYNSGNMRLYNTTVSGNTATSPEAGVGGIEQVQFAVLNNVTITNNTGVGNNPGSFRGGGIQTSNGATTVMKNSIVAGNDGGTGPNDCVGSLTADSKYNLIGDSNGCVIPAFVSTYLLDVDPQLSALNSYGGATPTHILGSSSPAREAAYEFPPPAVNACESHDQRGVPRPQGAGRCDMGAVEMTSGYNFVIGFVLVDADSDTDIRLLLHGDILDLSELPPNISVRAEVSGSPGSVVFDLNTEADFQTENISPYSLGGDAFGDYIPVSIAEGETTLRATPYADPGGSGSAGGSLEIIFTVRG